MSCSCLLCQLIKVNKFTGGSKLFFKCITTSCFSSAFQSYFSLLHLEVLLPPLIITTWVPVSLPWAGLKYVIGVLGTRCSPFHSGGLCWHVAVDDLLCIIFTVMHLTVISKWVLAWWFIVNNAWQPISYGGTSVVCLPNWNICCDGKALLMCPFVCPKV